MRWKGSLGLILGGVIFVAAYSGQVSGCVHREKSPKQGVATGICGKETVPVTVQEAVSTHYPGYRVITAADMDQEMIAWLKQEHQPEPCAWLQSDFDGNGQQDYAVSLMKFGENKVMWRGVVFLKREQKLFPVEFDWWEHECDHPCQSSGVETYFQLVQPGTTIHEFEGFTIPSKLSHATLKFPGIEIVYFERKAYVYFWNLTKKKFDVIQISD